MSLKLLAAASLAMFALVGCQSIPKNQSLAEYCSNSEHADKDVCKVNVEIDGQKTALASTNMSLSEARAIADKALASSGTAQAAADRAQQAALAAQQAAMMPIQCETKTVRKSDTGACSPGYKLVSCTQTHYTKRAGGVGIIRTIDDSSCKFNTKVLEIQARCCAEGASAPAPTQANDTTPQQAPTPPAVSN